MPISKVAEGGKENFLRRNSFLSLLSVTIGLFWKGIQFIMLLAVWRAIQLTFELPGILEEEKNVIFFLSGWGSM